MELGVHFALNEEQATRLLAAAGDDALLDEILEDIEENRLYLDSCDTDKAWDPIICALNGGYEYTSDNWPLSGVILGAKELTEDGEDQMITHLAPAQVREVASAVDTIDDAEFASRYEAMPEDERNPEYGPEELEYAWSYLRGLKDFFGIAAVAGHHVIFTVVF